MQDFTKVKKKKFPDCISQTWKLLHFPTNKTDSKTLFFQPWLYNKWNVFVFISTVLKIIKVIWGQLFVKPGICLKDIQRKERLGSGLGQVEAVSPTASSKACLWFKRIAGGKAVVFQGSFQHLPQVHILLLTFGPVLPPHHHPRLAPAYIFP